MHEPIEIVVLGAGYGGVLTAKKIARKVKRLKQSVTITVIDKNPYHTMLTELHEVAADRVPEEAIKISLKKIFAGRPVKLVQDTILAMDLNEKRLTSAEATYPYDYLIIGTGSQPTFFGVEGAKENSYKLWSFEDAVVLKEQIQKCFRQAAVTQDPEKRRGLLTFVTVGSGFTGVEMIGELAEWVPKLCQINDIPRDEVRLIVADQLPKILPIFPDHLTDKASDYLSAMGVEVMTSMAIEGILANGVQFGSGEFISAQTVIWCAGVESASLLASADLEKAGRNRVQTNAYLQSVSHESVYVVGDNIFYIPEGSQSPVPQMVENAEHSAETVAHNVIAEINGSAKKVYKPAFHGAMVSIGGRYGVAHLGLPGRFFSLSGFFAMFVKHFINVIYFLQVAGFNKIWTYMMHEGFHVKDRRSFVGGHFSKASPNFWLVPLRLFVGYKWLTEGWNKLPKVLEDPTKIFLIPPSPDWAITTATPAADAAANGAVDAVTTATQAAWVAAGSAGASGTAGAAASAGEQVSAWGEALPVPEFVQTMSKVMMDWLFYGPDDSYTWLATVFQTGMVFAEIIVGALLILGLFSAGAAIVSLIMGVMIYVSGMAPFEMRWYWAAGFALIGGSGSVFGLDYFVYPPLKKWWRNIPIVKKYYLYTE